MPNNDWEVASFSVPLEYTPEHTHCEIDPQLFSVYASLIPYPEHNSTPRVTGGTAMVKQSLGLPSSNYRLRPDTRAHIYTTHNGQSLEPEQWKQPILTRGQVVKTSSLLSCLFTVTTCRMQLS